MLNEKKLRVAMLAPITWRTPPKKYGPWERVVSLITEGLVKREVEVTFFATANSQTSARLRAACPQGLGENKNLDVSVWTALHFAQLFESADEFDVIHNNFDIMPLTYARLITTPIVTTIHGFPSSQSHRVYEHYDSNAYYVSISNANRHPSLHYLATVYHGIDIENFTFNASPEEYLLFFGRIHNDKGTKEAIEVARATGHRLLIAGLIQDEEYFSREVKPHLDDQQVAYVGNVGPAERDRLLGGAKALLHLINFDEPFGLSVAEAMACGTPVIAFNRGSMPEIIQDGITGFLVNTVDQAVRAVQKIPQLDRQASRHRIETNFTTERMVSRYLQVYEQAIADW